MWPDEIAQMARKGYDVAVTQTDAYIATLLDELDTLGVSVRVRARVSVRVRVEVKGKG